MDIKERIKEEFNNKSFRLGGYSALLSIVVIAIAVFVVLTVDSMSSKYTKFDMTSRALYTLSEDSVNVAKAIDKEVNIFMIAQSGSEDSITYNLIEKYAGYNSKINVEIKDPIINPNFAKNYTNEDVSNNSLIINCGEKTRYIGFTDIYKSETDYNTYQQKTEFDGENVITAALKYVTSDNLPRIYMTTGHGESALQPGFEKAIKRQSVITKEISLLTLDAVPEDAALIFINAPSADIAENEKDILLKYLKNGGKMIVVTGYDGVEKPVLNDLMRNYKVECENKLIIEGDNTKSLAGYNYFLVPNMQGTTISDPLIAKKYSVLLPLAHPINVLTDSDKSAIAVDFLTTSMKAYAKSDAENAQTFDKTEDDETGRFVVGVSITEEVDNDEETKILWVSSAQFVDDNINQIVSGGNQDLFLNALNWMCGREESIAIHSKSLENNLLAVPSGAVSLWSLIFIFLIPALFIAAGIYVLIKRKKN